MKTPPTDLTALAKNSGGKYPSAHVASVIRGQGALPSHGSQDMPVWGALFSSISQGHAAQVQRRTANLLAYIETASEVAGRTGRAKRRVLLRSRLRGRIERLPEFASPMRYGRSKHIPRTSAPQELLPGSTAGWTELICYWWVWRKSVESYQERL